MSQEVLVDSAYIAGQSITVVEKGQQGHFLQVTHADGQLIVFGKEENDHTTYTIPSLISTKASILNLDIYDKKKLIWKGETQILINRKNPPVIESYCGPKHLIVSKSDFAMVTTTILDAYDNPYPFATPYEVNYLVKGTVRKTKKATQHLLGFDRVYAPKKSGFGSVSNSYQNIGSKEFRLDFYANDPSNYQISYQRQHEYADGNQMINIATSVIKDAFGNQVENGTLVYFTIIDSDKKITHGTSETFDGVARMQLPAPLSKSTWNISSYIPHYAQSNDLSIDFKASITDFPIKTNDQSIIVGPIKGFMNQLLREGTPVLFELKRDGNSTEYIVSSAEGMAILNFNTRLVTKGHYVAKITLGNITKQVNIEVQ